jgi:hypothetical protein
MLLLTNRGKAGTIWERNERARKSVATGPKFSFASVEAALIATYRVAPADQARFRARVTHAQGSGLFNVRPGKGVRLTYGPDELHKLVLICELSELGLPPAVQLELIGTLWERRLQPIFRLAEAAASRPPGSNDVIVILFGVSLMVGAWGDAVPNVNHCSLDQLAGRLALAMRGDDAALPARALAVNLSARLRNFHACLATVHLKFEQPPIEVPGSVQRQLHAPSESVPAGRRRARDPKRAGRRRQS